MKNVIRLARIIFFYLTYPLLMPVTRNTHRSRVLIYSKSGNILVVRGWHGNGKWLLPGGGIKKNESAGQGARREVLEEADIEINAKDLVFVRKVNYSRAGLKMKFSIFKVNLPSEPTPIPLWYEISDAEWIKPKELNNHNSTYDLLFCLKSCYNKDYV